ncbi:DUF1349 domain-containing protein [Kitasatospora sp. NPDC059327]|uniref:DUF1349 domain-containing protein n=1 Tax=Kitasatospora sp. NPDC059327 TaxID=3346803 RepID=UPI0036CFD22C
MSSVELPGMTLEWAQPPADWTYRDGALTVVAGAGTDIFTPPLGGDPRTDAPRALTVEPVQGDWQFGARLRVGFRDSWDAGALLVWSDAEHWAKVNFEYAPDGHPAVFSVVTRGRSDDAVGGRVDDEHLWLRISRIDGAFAFHASSDGKRWSLVRQFDLDGSRPVRVGIEAQSPVGQGCEVVFDEIAFTPERLADLLDGS